MLAVLRGRAGIPAHCQVPALRRLTEALGGDHEDIPADPCQVDRQQAVELAAADSSCYSCNSGSKPGPEERGADSRYRRPDLELEVPGGAQRTSADQR